MLTIHKYPDPATWEELMRRPRLETHTLEKTVNNILTQVRETGDRALIKYACELDRATIDEVIVSQNEMDHAVCQVSDQLKVAIQTAAKNIRTFHESQVHQEDHVETSPGVVCWRENRPIAKVGLYIPGGTAPLFSTVLMLAIPASIAGCQEIVLSSPPRGDGSIDPVILYCAGITGVHKVIKAGGAQAIAAMAYGTESIPKVDKIFGPGNQYVTAAKQQVSLDGTAIDMPAGPSEVAVIADKTSNPEFVAIDLLSQAEHGADSQVILICTDEEIINRTQEQINVLLSNLPRKEFIAQSLSNSRAILVNDLDEAIQLSNAYAPEHLILSIDSPRDFIPFIQHAGSVFLGHYTPEAAGDYASGTNHTLPTNGAARAFSGVSMDSFLKKITFQSITEKGLNILGPSISAMAQAEQLTAHKMAVTLRTNDSGKDGN